MQISARSLKQASLALSRCKHLGPVIKKFGHCQIDPAAEDPFDTLIGSIISQQLSVKAAATIDARVRALVGQQYQPQALLQHEHLTLRGCGLSNRKVEYIQGIARAVSDGQIDFSLLQQADDQEVMRQLVSLRGVGQWTAEMFMIFSLGRMDIFSSLDVGLQRGMRILFGEQASDLKSMEKLAERWQPYRSIASWYLWKVVD